MGWLHTGYDARYDSVSETKYLNHFTGAKSISLYFHVLRPPKNEGTLLAAGGGGG